EWSSSTSTGGRRPVRTICPSSRISCSDRRGRYAPEQGYLAMSLTRMTSIRVFTALICLLFVPALSWAADRPSSAQKAAASEYLDAAASGSPQAVALAIPPSDLEALRNKVLTQLREEAANGDATVRVRLFGRGKSLAEIERLTPIDFYATL